MKLFTCYQSSALKNKLKFWLRKTVKTKMHCPDQQVVYSFGICNKDVSSCVIFAWRTSIEVTIKNDLKLRSETLKSVSFSSTLAITWMFLMSCKVVTMSSLKWRRFATFATLELTGFQSWWLFHLGVDDLELQWRPFGQSRRSVRIYHQSWCLRLRSWTYSRNFVWN